MVTDVESGDVVALKGVSEAGTGVAVDDEKKRLSEIVAKMNDLFSGEISEADFLGSLTTWKGHLLADKTLAVQAKANTEEQFAMGSFKDAFMDVVIDAQDAQNSIADQMPEGPAHLWDRGGDAGEDALSAVSSRPVDVKASCGFVTGRFTAVQIRPFNCLEPRTFRTDGSCRPAASGGADA